MIWTVLLRDARFQPLFGDPLRARRLEVSKLLGTAPFPTRSILDLDSGATPDDGRLQLQ